MGLFDAKYCSLCGNKVGLLGKTTLSDGYLCKDCSSKLSPFLTGTKRLTVEDIKDHLEYREKNQDVLAKFEPNIALGGRKKIYIDEKNKLFVVSSASDYRRVNADVIPFSEVLGVENTVEEDREEEFYKDNEGNKQSYNPPRFTYSYTFLSEITLNSRWFSSIKVELSDKEEPDQLWNDLYRELDYQARTLKSVLTGKPIEEPAINGGPVYNNYPSNTPINNYNQNNYNQNNYNQNNYNNTSWRCAKCGNTNTGNFCGTCGAPRPTYTCPRCGWTPNDYKSLPRFCSNCGWEMNNY
ncbi:MAG: DUF4428 domain-containing protein [Erysipelotrichaceae bacterium]|nr:DUF4428 domain-containing protein [Erysipelotrichaceae bacterium]